MSYTSYTRATLEAEVRRFFGIDTNSDNLTVVHAALDQAIQRIIRARPYWHFLEKNLVLDVLGSESVTVTFTQGSASAVISPVAPATGLADFKRHILADEDTTNIVDGYVILADDGAGNITLDAKYTGTSGAKTCTTTLAFYQLPENFTKIVNLYDMELVDRKISYLHSPDFDRMVRSRYAGVSGADYYTVVPDPVAEANPQDEDRRPYLMVFPYLMSRTTLRGRYYAQHQALDADNAVPLLPREFRPVIVDLARYYLAMNLGYEGAKMDTIRIEALTSLRDMLENYNFSTDTPETPGMSLGPMYFNEIEGSPSQGDLFFE